MDIADVAAVVIARDDELRELDLLDPARGLLVFPLVAVGREVAREHDDVRLDPAEVLEDRIERVGRQAQRAADVDVAHLRDAQRDLRDCGHVPPPYGIESPTIFGRWDEWNAA